MFAALFLLTLAQLDGGPPSGDEPSSSTVVKVHGALELSAAIFPSGFGENGADVLAVVHPLVGFSVGQMFGLEVGAPLRLRVIDTPSLNRPTDFGGVLRGPDWDELSDFGQIVQELHIGATTSPVRFEVGLAPKKTLGAGHVVWRYSNQTNANYHPVSGDLVVQAGPIHGELFASDMLGARLFAADVAWDIGGTFTRRPDIVDRYVLALSLAHDFNLAGRPFRPDPSVSALTPASVTVLHLDASAVLVRTSLLRWSLLGGVGTRANATADLGFLLGTTFDAQVADLGFSVRLEARKQAGGFRHGFFGPAYELQRFSDLGFSGTPLGEVALPDGFSGFAEVRVGLGTRLTFDVAAEYFFSTRLDLHGSLSLALLEDWLFASLRSSLLGLSQAPRFSVSAGLRWRLFRSFYLLAEGGTVFFPQADGSLLRGVTASAGAGVDFER